MTTAMNKARTTVGTATWTNEGGDHNNGSKNVHHRTDGGLVVAGVRVGRGGDSGNGSGSGSGSSNSSGGGGGGGGGAK